MLFRFPLKDVTIKVTNEKTRVTDPLYVDEWNEISQREFTIDVEEVAWFYASGGNYIEVSPYTGYSQDSLELFLNSTVYAAVLQQRQILAIHGSCFQYRGKNLMVCGESGAGKSSLTVAFCMEGCRFITDDVSPIVFEHGKPFVLPLSDRAKLWDNSLDQLGIEKGGLQNIHEDMEKFYFPVTNESSTALELQHIFVLEVGEEVAVPEMEEISGAEKLTILRSQIYRLEMLQGMPENDLAFFPKLALIGNAVKITRIRRPARIPILDLKNYLKKYLDQ
jgi:hypothetical protein